jgi:phage terminase large subunit-like protein
MLRSGRGAGKTRAGSEKVIEWAQQEIGPIALIGQTKADVRDTMIEVGDSSILRRSPPWFMPEYEPSKRRVVWPNGVIAIAYSGDEPDQLRGPQHAKAWVDELAKFKYAERTMDNLEFGLRVGPLPQGIITTTPRSIRVIKDLLADPDCIDVRVSTFANIDNLPPKFVERLRKKYGGTTLGRQELYGEVIDEIPGALWPKRSLIKHVDYAPTMERIVVGVDPAASSKEGSNETGIVVCGKCGYDFYVLEDLSGVYTPLEWAKTAIAAYHRWKADLIVAERNNGGDMVESTIRREDTTVAIKPDVWASKGKSRRAEPVVALYEQGHGHHNGAWSTLEDQMCTWLKGATVNEMGWSPDRMDAMVWAATELMLDSREISVGSIEL